MDRAQCPQCGYAIGLGTASELGRCPSCDLPLMLTSEFRALGPDACLDLARAGDGDGDQRAQGPVETSRPREAAPRSRRTTALGTP